MHFSTLLLTSILTPFTTAQGPPPDAVFPGEADYAYPLCPENYDTYCCFTVVPYSTHCSKKTGCTNEPGWSCLMGPGKVDSIRACKENADDKSAYCKRPGYEYFPSILEWTGNSFSPVLEPSDYRHWVRPGMKEPWTPGHEEIVWEDVVDNATYNDDLTEDVEASELR